MRPWLSVGAACLAFGCSVPSVEFYDASVDATADVNRDVASDSNTPADGGPLDAETDGAFCTTTSGPLPDGAAKCCSVGQPCYGRCNPHDCAGCTGCALCCTGTGCCL